MTDAQVALGRMDADKLLGGDLPVDPSLAERAIEAKIARKLNLSVKEAALGIIRVINSNMALAIRSNSVARGVDPREFSLVPFGGAGPLHGVALAEAVAARDVIVPVAPGITAATGAARDRHAVRARALPHHLPHPCRRGRRAPHRRARRGARGGVPPRPGERRRPARAGRGYQRFAECRYHGQGFELRADIAEGEVTAAGVRRIVENFHAQHRLDYGYAFDDGEVELITVRVIGTEKVKPLEVARIGSANGSGIDNAFLYSRPTTFDDGETVDTRRATTGSSSRPGTASPAPPFSSSTIRRFWCRPRTSARCRRTESPHPARSLSRQAITGRSPSRFER